MARSPGRNGQRAASEPGPNGDGLPAKARRTAEEVDAAAAFLQSKGVTILKGPQTHKEDRDRYVYFEDPDGNMLELVASTIEGWPGTHLR